MRQVDCKRPVYVCVMNVIGWLLNQLTTAIVSALIGFALTRIVG